MSVAKSENITEVFAEAINESVKWAIGDAFDKAIEEAVKQANDRRDEVIAATALKLSSWVNYQDMGTTLRITVEKPAEPK